VSEHAARSTIRILTDGTEGLIFSDDLIRRSVSDCPVFPGRDRDMFSRRNNSGLLTRVPSWLFSDGRVLFPVTV
jgi:hypothetical protein